VEWVEGKGLGGGARWLRCTWRGLGKGQIGEGGRRVGNSAIVVRGGWRWRGGSRCGGGWWQKGGYCTDVEAGSVVEGDGCHFPMFSGQNRFSASMI
jgi:hypothetical protein